MARPSLMFRLGQFVGGVARGVTQPIKGQRQVLTHDVQEQTQRQGDTTVTLRRTTIEEVEVRPADPHRPRTEPGRAGPT